MEKIDLKRAILEILNENRTIDLYIPGSGPVNRKHKHNMLGGQSMSQRGDIEYHLDIIFEEQDRQLAAKAFDELRADGHIAPTYGDLTDPENWVGITDLGREWLKNSLKDHIDECLELIGKHLPESRRGMWDALKRNSPDSCRQAAHSARELLDQTLKIGAPDLKTRKERARYIMKKFRGSASKSDVTIIEAHFKVLVGEHDKLLKLSHARSLVSYGDTKDCIESAERILKLLFGSKKSDKH